MGIFILIKRTMGDNKCCDGKKKYCWIGICVVLVLAVIIGIVAAVTGGGKVPKLAIENCRGPLKDDASRSKKAAYAVCVRLNTGLIASWKASVKGAMKSKKAAAKYIKEQLADNKELKVEAKD